ncbi:hypothetical protein B0H13DRAFT_381638 [Mycena leptocephala]|nr:hypothetical protein B0H13DRAFT_381638 [Mycena leptocephala]
MYPIIIIPNLSLAVVAVDVDGDGDTVRGRDTIVQEAEDGAYAGAVQTHIVQRMADPGELNGKREEECAWTRRLSVEEGPHRWHGLHSLVASASKCDTSSHVPISPSLSIRVQRRWRKPRTHEGRKSAHPDPDSRSPSPPPRTRERAGPHRAISRARWACTGAFRCIRKPRSTRKAIAHAWARKGARVSCAYRYPPRRPSRAHAHTRVHAVARCLETEAKASSARRRRVRGRGRGRGRGGEDVCAPAPGLRLYLQCARHLHLLQQVCLRRRRRR